MSDSDHDMLIEIRNDVKHLVLSVSKHTKDDEVSFEKVDDRLKILEKAYLKATVIGSMIIVAVNVLIKFIKI